MIRDADSRAFQQILAALKWTLESLADELCPVAGGWTVRTHELPMVWTLNQVRITAPASVTEVVELSEAHQGRLPYRHVVVEDDDTAAELQTDLAHKGWKIDREVLMALESTPESAPDTGAVTELDVSEMLDLVRRWDMEELPGTSEEALGQLEEWNRREGQLWHETCLGVRSGEGTPVALTKLRAHGKTRWVEDVYTAPEERRRGHARMLVTRATQLARSARPDLTFILADDNNWPKRLYGALGFRPVGYTRTFHRSLAP